MVSTELAAFNSVSNAYNYMARELTESVRVLHPVHPIRRIHGRRIARDIAEAQVCPVHDVEGPQRRILDGEILHEHLGHIPEDERHGSAGLRHGLLGIVPRIAVAVYLSSAVSLDCNVVASNDETSVVVLEADRIGVVAPVVEVIGQLHKESV
jgi:hypothetical protein